MAFNDDIIESSAAASSPVMKMHVTPATQIFTATVGRKPTQAKAFFTDVYELTHLLKKSLWGTYGRGLGGEGREAVEDILYSILYLYIVYMYMSSNYSVYIYMAYSTL